MRKKLGAYAYPVLLPIGTEDQLKGEIDIVNQKAIIYSDERRSSARIYEVTDIPAEHKERSPRRMPT